MHILGDVTRLGDKVSSFTREAHKVMVLLACARGGRRRLEQDETDGSNNTLDLPSWVPDWTAPLPSRPFVFDQRFRAGGDTFEVDWNHEAGLQLCGKLVDTVEVVGTVLLDYSPNDTASDAHSKIEQWWHESQLIALSGNARSPGSTMNVDAFKGLCRDLAICSEYLPCFATQKSLTRKQSMATTPASVAAADTPQRMNHISTADAVCLTILSCIKMLFTAHTTLLPWDLPVDESSS